MSQVIFEECLEVGDLPTLQKIQGYSEAYLTEEEWQELLERYSQLYLVAASDIDHPYIPLVRLGRGEHPYMPQLPSFVSGFFPVIIIIKLLPHCPSAKNFDFGSL